MDDWYLPFVIISLLLLSVALVKVAAFLSLSLRHHARYKRYHPAALQTMPYISIIIPCYNEELTLANCLESLLAQNYSYYEIIIVNDGSADRTWQVARHFARAFPHIRASSQPNGGKARALNLGIEQARGEIVICIDADSMFMADTVQQLALSFEDPTVTAVGGNVRVANRTRLLNRHQALEYITGLTLQRKAFAYLGCMQVISGAIGAFRREALLAVGGYSHDTIVEDMDITITLARHGCKIVYNPLAIAYTEAPETLRDFFKQRYRWIYGGFQVIAKHRDLLFRRHHNRMGTVGMPYFAIFPWVDVLVSLFLVATIARVAATRDGWEALVFFAAMSCIHTSLVMYALTVDKENKKLALLAGLDNLFYNQLISLTTVWAGANYVLRRKTSWRKGQRYGKNTVAVVTANSG